jgi:hypothetical protein
MGLDIHLYTGIKILEDQKKADKDYDSGVPHVCYLYSNPDFPEQADGIKNGFYYFTEEDHFHAGSYSGYGQFRRQLCQFAHKKDIEELWENETSGEVAFIELLNFSDCEGIIGPKTSLKLAEDFWEYRKQLPTDPTDELYEGHNYSFFARFNFFANFFEKAASTGGVVKFA